jgi:hypothetical protein
VLVKDLIGAQQRPKALYTLPVGHASLLLKSKSIITDRLYALGT